MTSQLVTNLRVALLTGLLLALSVAGAAAAEPQVEGAEAPNAATPEAGPQEGLEQVVVTATATGVRKLDASYTITAVNSEAIKMANPKSTADLLKVSPGLWPESTG